MEEKPREVAAYFLTLSAGIASPQNTNEARPPERKFAVPVPIYFNKLFQSSCNVLRKPTSYGVPCDCENPRMSNYELDINLIVREEEECDVKHHSAHTSKAMNIHMKLLRKARLPVKPVHRPNKPCARMICLPQSIGPLNWRLADDF